MISVRSSGDSSKKGGGIGSHMQNAFLMACVRAV